METLKGWNEGNYLLAPSGSIVRVKSFETMKEEFGVTETGAINLPRNYLGLKKDSKLLGKTYEVNGIKDQYRVSIKGGNHLFIWEYEILSD